MSGADQPQRWAVPAEGFVDDPATKQSVHAATRRRSHAPAELHRSRRRPTGREGPPLRVFVAGTFDGLHRGHLFLLAFARRRGARLALRQARSGVHLTVVVARDESVRRIKGRLPHHRERERLGLVAALKMVDSTFVGYRGDFLRSVRRAQPDLIVLGYDQSARWEHTLRTAGFATPVIRCPPYDGARLKSSRLRAEIVNEAT